MKLLVDMNLTPRWVPWLVARGYDAAHWSQIGALNAPDARLMDHALADGSVFLTSDLDFGALLASSGDSGPSVILLRAGMLTPERMGAALTECRVRFRREIETGAIVVVDGLRHKVRLVPIRATRS